MVYSMLGNAVLHGLQSDMALERSRRLTFADLPLLSGLWMPVWLFDSGRNRMLWANQAALELWNAASYEEFLRQDFSDMSKVTRSRLEWLEAQVAAGEPVIDQWSVCPAGKSIATPVRCTGMLLPDGRLGILHEAQIIEQPVDPATLRGAEALNHTTVQISLFALDGTPLMRNPAAQTAFGPVEPAGEHDCLASHFAHEQDRRDLMEALSRGETFSRLVEINTKRGPRWHGLDARIATDPVSGEPVALVNERDVTEQVRAEQALQESERRLAIMVENLPAGAAYIEGETIFLNRGAEEISGYTRAEVPTLDAWFRAAYPNNHGEIRRRYYAAREAGAPVSVELQITRKDGTLRWIHFSAYLSKHGEVWKLMDVTNYREAAEALRHERALLQGIMDAIPDAVFYKDRGGEFCKMNAAFAAWLGKTPEDVVGLSCHNVWPPDLAEEIERHDALVYDENQPRRDELMIPLPNGEAICVEMLKAPISDSNGALMGLVGIGRDITERKRIEEALRQSEAEKSHLANHDALTGLPNRRLFHDRLRIALENARCSDGSLALLFIDLDGFKTVNDVLGHDYGDHILRVTAARIAECLRRSDIVARLGGDEFTAVLENVTSANDVGRVAAKIIKAVSTPIPVHGQDATIGASVGIALYPQDALNVRALLVAADGAMYQAKQAGRGTFVFHTNQLSTG